jgi:hypothetical protein
MSQSRAAQHSRHANARIIVGLVPDLETTKQVLRDLRAQGIPDDVDDRHDIFE